MGKFNVEDYTTVDDRIKMLKEDFPDSRIITERESNELGGDIEVFRAIIFKNKEDQQDQCPFSTGYAQEIRDKELQKSKQGYEYESVNYTSWLENCETSAVGRALANMGYTGKGGRPSREEMEKVERMQGKKQEKATARDLRGVNSSTDMNVNKAISYIRDTDPEKLDGFVTEEEDRITILRVWDSKMGTNLSGEYDEDTSSSSDSDSESSDKPQKEETGTEQSASDRTVQDAINEILESDKEPAQKVNALVQGIYQVHTNPSHEKFEDREFSQYDAKQFQEEFYDEFQQAIAKVQS